MASMYSMTRRQFTKTALAAGLVGLPLHWAKAEPKPPLNLNEPLDVLQKRINNQMQTRLDHYGVPGLSLMLIREGKSQWTEAYGIKDLDQRRPVDTNTVFETSALTKPIAAFVALTLWKEGRLDLDRPFGLYLDQQFKDTIPESYLDITARIVLGHTTGLPNMSAGPRPPKLAFEPGERFSYSGIGYTLLQEVMHGITGESIDVLCRKRVLDPLNMDRSSLVWRDEFENTLATAYGKKLKRGIKRKLVNPMARSSLVCSPSEYGKFVSHVLETSKRKTNGRLESIYRIMLKSQVDVQEGLSWGLGWGLQTCGDEQAFWHWGNNEDKYHSFAIGYPEHGLGLVIMCNSGNGLRLCRELVPDIIGGCHPAFDWHMVIP